MSAGKKQICPDWNISKSVVPITTSGKISFWPLAVLMVLIVFAGVSIYRVVDLHAKVRVVLEESTAQAANTMDGYKIPHVTLTRNHSIVSFENEVMDSAGQPLDNRIHTAAGQIKSFTSQLMKEWKESSSTEVESEEKVMPLPGHKDNIEILPVPGKTNPDQKKGVAIAKPEIKSKEDQKTLYVNVSVGRIRQEASLDAKIISRLYKGERVTVLESSMDWYRIDAEDGRKGWAHGELFSNDAPLLVKRPKPLIKAIWVEECTEEKGKIFIELDGYHLPKTLVLEGDRPRVACDFHGIEADPALLKTMAVYTGIIQSIRLGVHGEGKAKTRVVVDLLPQNNYIVEQQYFIEKDIYLLEIHCK